MFGTKKEMFKCLKCNKTFDYGKHSGVCPHCGRYNSKTTAEQDHQAYHNQYDDGYTHSEEDNHTSFHAKYDNGYTHTAQDDHYNFHDKYDTAGNTCKDTTTSYTTYTSDSTKYNTDDRYDDPSRYSNDYVDGIINADDEAVKKKLKSYVGPGIIMFLVNPIILIIAAIIVCATNKEILPYVLKHIGDKKNNN